MTRLALLINDVAIDRWAAETVSRALQETDAELSLAVVNEESREYEEYLSFVHEEGVWTAQRLVERIKNRVRTPPYREPVGLNEFTDEDGVEIIRCEPINTAGFGVEFPEHIVTKIEQSVDIAVRFGFGIINGLALSAPEYGVLSFHHGDFRKYRGRPAGFWEFMNNEPTAKITLQQLSKTVDAGTIVAERSVDIASAKTWQDIKQRLFTDTEPMLAAGINAVLEGDVEQLSEKELGDVYTRPNWRTYVRYLAKNTAGRVSFQS